jgi:hypothetical protein
MAGVSNQASEYFAELVRRSSRRIERLPIIKCVEETLSRRCGLATEEQDENQSVPDIVSFPR